MAQILSCREENQIYVKIVGRVSFLHSEKLSNFLGTRNLNCDVFFEMEQCESMDSTFMGTLAQIGLDIDGQKGKLFLLNTSSDCYKLLEELGLTDFLNFENQEVLEKDWKTINSQEISQYEQQKHIYEAHKTLVDIYEPNATEFEFVLEYLKSEDEEGGK